MAEAMLFSYERKISLFEMSSVLSCTSILLCLATMTVSV